MNYLLNEKATKKTLNLDNKISDLFDSLSRRQFYDVLHAAPELIDPAWRFLKTKNKISEMYFFITKFRLPELYINDFIKVFESNKAYSKSEENRGYLVLFIIGCSEYLKYIPSLAFPYLLSNKYDLRKALHAIVNFGSPEQVLSTKSFIVENLSDDFVEVFCQQMTAANKKVSFKGNYSLEDYYSDLPEQYRIGVVL